MFGGGGYGKGGDDRRGGMGLGYRRGNFPGGRNDSGPRGGAEHLARIHGTEEDKVNCPFYYKIGACRHGERCSRQHHKPPFSQTILLSHMFQNPASAVVAAGGNPELIDQDLANDEFEDFFEEVFEELCKFGVVEEMNVCDNLGDHLVGNVYVKFSDEEEADNALKGLFGRWYAGRPMVPEFSPVTDFREARCRQYDEGTCGRGGQCNFMHVRYVSRDVMTYCDKLARKARRVNRSKSRSRSRDRRKRSRSKERDRRDRDGRRSRRGDSPGRSGRDDRHKDDHERRSNRRDSRDRGGRRERHERDSHRPSSSLQGNGEGRSERDQSKPESYYQQ